MTCNRPASEYLANKRKETDSSWSVVTTPQDYKIKHSTDYILAGS
jgi:hypothetical protein